jgi:type I site-specific restriction-modification system R (restriction) subunit
VNGLPLILFELKNPYSDQPTVDDAHNQVQHYRNEIAQVFDFNALTIVSDGGGGCQAPCRGAGEGPPGPFPRQAAAEPEAEALGELVRDEIQLRKKKNLPKAKSFQQLLEATLQRYHNRLIDAAAGVKALLEIHKDMESDDKRAKDLNLEPEEVAFYDAVAAHHANLYEPSFLRDLIHDIVQTIRKNLKVDWTEPHREDVKAAVRAAVKRVLRKRGVKDEHFDVFLERIMEQAEAIYATWPVAA